MIKGGKMNSRENRLLLLLVLKFVWHGNILGNCKEIRKSLFPRWSKLNIKVHKTFPTSLTYEKSYSLNFHKWESPFSSHALKTFSGREKCFSPLKQGTRGEKRDLIYDSRRGKYFFQYPLQVSFKSTHGEDIWISLLLQNILKSSMKGFRGELSVIPITRWNPPISHLFPQFSLAWESSHESGSRKSV